MSAPLALDAAHVTPLERALAEPRQGFLQVLVDAFTLERRGAGVALALELRADQPAIRDRAAKAALARAAAAGPGERRLAAELARPFDSAPVRLDCRDCPLRWANGGVLPLVRVEGRDHAALFLREIEPVGWNLANGASDTLAELLDPARVARRELVEELLVVDPTRRVRYALEGPELAETPADALAAWAARLALPSFERAWLPVRWGEGPDIVRVRVAMELGPPGTASSDPSSAERATSAESSASRRPAFSAESSPAPARSSPAPARSSAAPARSGPAPSSGAIERETAGHWLVISPEDQALELDRVVHLDLPPGAALLDGEHVRGEPLDRVIGLFELAALRARMAAGAPLVPDRAFRGGVARAEPLLDLATEALEDLVARGLTSEAERRHVTSLPPERRFGPCPPTRALVTALHAGRPGS